MAKYHRDSNAIHIEIEPSDFPADTAIDTVSWSLPAACSALYHPIPWPAPDPSARVDVHGCDYLECPNGATTRYGNWGQWVWLCFEHAEVVGDDGSMDDTYETDAERDAAMAEMDWRRGEVET